MEQINKIELRGNVGSIRIQNVNDTKVARFTVATNYAMKKRDGTAVIETTWHFVTAWEGKNIADLDQIMKGSKVHLTGRMRSQKFNDIHGEEKYSYEVYAQKLDVLNGEESLSYEL